ncbi:MAG: hypothetical protein HFACDABA_00219 [Anaerolineales bacterium]|nr:hypothetical protein [Anaerolineales bacterium]
MLPRSKFILPIVATLLFFALTQLQPFFLNLFGAVDGSFGLRPLSHKCAGIKLSGEWIAARLSPADWEAKLGYFVLRYYVPQNAADWDFCGAGYLVRRVRL